MDYPYLDYVRDDILQMVPSEGQVIGSIGCGRAATEAVLVAKGRQVHGVDVASEVVDAASARLTTFRLVGYDEMSPFEPNSLDGLILADVIEHIPLAWERLKTFTRAVRVGGWVVISVPNMRNLKTLGTFVVGGDWPEDDTGIFDRTHLQVCTRRRLDRWCAQSGLRVERHFPQYLSNATSKGTLLKAFDRATFGAMQSWLTMQIQVRCRRVS